VTLAVPGAARTARAQPASDTTAASADPIASLVADRLARDALLLLRNITSPTTDDSSVTARLLEEAARLIPDDPSLVRLIIQAWHDADDEDRVIDWTRRLVRLDPADETALLRLISHRINTLQDVETRQGAFDKLIVADALGPAIRSRLALDDALLAREIGDDQRFLDRLTLSTTLDSTNKEAAALAAAYALPRTDDALARVELMANIVLADPLDPAALRDLAEEFMSFGAYKAAKRFFPLARQLAFDDDPAIARSIRGRLLLANWATEGTRPLLDLLDESERSQRHTIETKRDDAVTAGDDPSTIPDYTPDPLNETVRLGLTLALGDPVESQRSLGRLIALSDQRVAALTEQNTGDGAEETDPSDPAAATDQTPTSAPVDPDEVAAALAAEARERLWLRLWSGLELDQAEAALADPAPLGADAPLALYRGALAAQRGDLAAARSMLEPLADTDPRARVALALADERAGDTDNAQRRLARLTLDAPGTLWGIWDRARLETHLGRAIPASADAQALEAYAEAMPDAIDRMVTEPRSMLDMHAELSRAQYAPFERIELTVRLRNTSPIPLALGPTAPIPSDVLLAPRLTIGTRDGRENLSPEVLSIGRKLRLEPGESISVGVWVDRGALGAVLDRSALASAHLRIRLIERFTVSNDARFLATPLSVTTDTAPVRRTPIALTRGGRDRLPDLIRSAAGQRLAETALLTFNIVALARANPDAPGPPEQLQRIAEAFSERLPSTDRFERAMLTRLLPLETAAAPLAPVIDTLRQDPDRLVRLAFLLGRVNTADAPILTTAEAGDDSLVADTAAMIRRVLTARAQAQAADASP